MPSADEPRPPQASVASSKNDETARHLMLAQWRHSHQSAKTRVLLMGLAALLVLLYLFSLSHVEGMTAAMERHYLHMIDPMSCRELAWLLPVLGFVGGLMASISPCIVALAPISLGYVGTLESLTKRQSFLNALWFTLGIVLILTLFGLVEPFANAVLVHHKGLVDILVGLFALTIGLFFYEIINLPLAEKLYRIPSEGNAFAVGTLFGLVGTPCASPVLSRLLHIARVGYPGLPVVTMIFYAFGYAFLIFLAGWAAARLNRLPALKSYSSLFTQIAGLILVLFGGFYLWTGIRWFWG